MSYHGKSFQAAQRAWDNAEPEGDDDLNSSHPKGDTAWDDMPHEPTPKRWSPMYYYEQAMKQNKKEES